MEPRIETDLLNAGAGHLLSTMTCAQVALAVEYMHGLGVVHRDVKAENLVFVRAGAPALKLEFLSGESTIFVEPAARRRLAWSSLALKVLYLSSLELAGAEAGAHWR